MSDYILYAALLLAAVLALVKLKSSVTSLDARIGGERQVGKLKRKDVVLIIVGTIGFFTLLYLFDR